MTRALASVFVKCGLRVDSLTRRRTNGIPGLDTHVTPYPQKSSFHTWTSAATALVYFDPASRRWRVTCLGMLNMESLDASKHFSYVAHREISFTDLVSNQGTCQRPDCIVPSPYLDALKLLLCEDVCQPAHYVQGS